MTKGCLNLVYLVSLTLLQEVEAANQIASAGFIGLVICYFLILVGGIILLVMFSKKCNCKCQNKEADTTIRTVQQLSPVAFQHPEFSQTTCPQRTAPSQVQLTPPGTVPLMELAVGEPPPPYPGM